MVQEIIDKIAAAAARIEEFAYPHDVISPNFPRDLFNTSKLNCIQEKNGISVLFSLQR